MSEPFLSEIKIISWNFAPKGWTFCAGQLLPINQNQALFSLLGTTYGGDGRVNFGLPDLRDRVAMGQFGGHNLGERGGEAAHTLIQQELPAHNHFIPATTANGDVFNPGTHIPANAQPTQIYSPQPQTGVAMNPQMITTVGGNQAHNNLMPYIAMYFIIALQGIFPSQT